MASLLAVFFVMFLWPVWHPEIAFASDERPNFLIIVTDDQRFDQFNDEYMPMTKAMIADQGVRFERAYVTTSSCCPSRASILTGMHPRRHGVLRTTPVDLLRLPTLADRLHEAGYYTGLVGKYLNYWDGSPRAEFDYWAAHPGGESPYYNPLLNVNGTLSTVPGYITYLLRDQALDFLNRVPSGQPFLLLFTPNAPHAAADPAPEDKDLLPNLVFPRTPDFNETDVSDKPAWVQGLPLLRFGDIGAANFFWRKQVLTLRALDRSIADILDRLRSQGKLDQTVVIFTSDNGLLFGEHRIGLSKFRVYEPSVRVPFALRYPPLVRGSSVEAKLVANIDIAPTLYELAGLSIPSEVDGLSLVKLLRGTDPWRDALLIEGWELYPPFKAVHTGQYVYVETPSDISELYDLETDPYQLENRINDPQYKDIVSNLSNRLAEEIKRIVPVDKTPLAAFTVNGASFFPPSVPLPSGSLQPPVTAAGSIASVLGLKLASGVVSANRVPLPTSLSTTTIQIGGQAAPLFFVSPDQANIQIPWELAGQEAVQMRVAVDGIQSRTETVRLAAYAPGIFAVNQTGKGQGVIVISATGEVAAPAGSISGRVARPARRGEFLTIYCTGLGPVTNPPATGGPAPTNPLSETTTSAAVTIGRFSAAVSFSGLAPGFVGLYQVNVQVPNSAPTGSAVPLALSIGGAVSNTVTIAVQ